MLRVENSVRRRMEIQFMHIQFMYEDMIQA